jgi:hypothetical protein
LKEILKAVSSGGAAAGAKVVEWVVVTAALKDQRKGEMKACFSVVRWGSD